MVDRPLAGGCQEVFSGRTPVDFQGITYIYPLNFCL